MKILRFFTVFIFIVLSLNSHAMKRKQESDPEILKKRNIDNDYRIIHDDAFQDYIFKYLGLKDLHIIFVCKSWHEASKELFKDFYEFKKTYEDSIISYTKDMSLDNALNLAIGLKKADSAMIHRSFDEKQAIAKAFVAKNGEQIYIFNLTVNLKPISSIFFLEVGDEIDFWFRRDPEKWVKNVLLMFYCDADPTLCEQPCFPKQSLALEKINKQKSSGAFASILDLKAFAMDKQIDVKNRLLYAELLFHRDPSYGADVSKLFCTHAAMEQGPESSANALMLYSKAMEINPNNKTAITGAAVSNFKLNNFEKAEPGLMYWLELAPDNKFVIKCLAKVKVNLKKLEEAEALYAKLCVSDSSALYCTSLCNLELKNFKKAADQASEYCKKFSHDIAGLIHAGECYRRLGDNKKAKEYYLLAKEHYSGNEQNQIAPIKLVVLGQYLLKIENYEEAIRLILQAKEKGLNESIGNFQLGYAFAKLGDKNKAANYFKLFLDMDPEEIRTQLDFTIIDYQLNDAVDAIKNTFKSVDEKHYLEQICSLYT